MNAELAAMLANPAHWSQHLAFDHFGSFFNHHNSTLLPQVYSSGRSQTWFYGPSTRRFTTDEWTPEQIAQENTGQTQYWPTTWQLNLVDYISRANLFAACDSAGRLYTWGNDFPNDSQNALGHGPSVATWDTTHGSRQRRYGPTLVLGENGELADVRFVKCGIGLTFPSAHVTSAMSDEGVIYMSGGAARGQLGNPLASSRYYHKPLNGYTWKTYSHSQHGIVAIDYSGNAYSWGPTHFARQASQFVEEFYEVPTLVETTFIDEVTVEHPGSGSWGLLGIDPPQQSGGRQATLQISKDSSGAVIDAWILEPGVGYTSPPAVRFTATSEDPPVISCKLFSSSWKETSSDLSGLNGSLLSEDGYMYTYGVDTAEPFETPALDPNVYAYSPRKHLSTKMQKVVTADFLGAAIGEDKNLYMWGRFTNSGFFFIPGLERGKVRKLADGPFLDVVVTGSSVLAIREDGTVVGAGFNGAGELGVGDNVARTQLTTAIGSIRAKKLFNGFAGSFVVLRDQTYDAAGNPIYAT